MGVSKLTPKDNKRPTVLFNTLGFSLYFSVVAALKKLLWVETMHKYITIKG